MGFEIIKKNRFGGNFIEPTEVRSGSSVSFGREISADFIKKGNFLEVFINREDNKIGFLSTTNNLTGFKLQQDKSTDEPKFSVCVKEIRRLVGKNCFNAVKVGEMWVIEVKDGFKTEGEKLTASEVLANC